MREIKFRRREAEDKVGRPVESSSDGLGVPCGTRGEIIAAGTLDQCGYEVLVEWVRPGLRRALRVWLNKEQYRRHIYEY